MTETFGEFLKRKREENELTIVELSEKSGVSAAQISRIETGKRKNPKMETLQNLANALNVPLSEMMEKAGYLSGLKEDEYTNLENTMNTASNFLDDAIRQYVYLIGDAVLNKKPYHERIESELLEEIEKLVEEKGTSEELTINLKDPNRFNSLANFIVDEDTEFKTAAYGLVKEEATKYHLWEDPMKNTSPVNEQELVSKVELSDDELLKQFNFELDGVPLSQKEVKRLLAYLRTERSLDDQE